MREREFPSLVGGPCDGLPLPESAHLVARQFAVKVPGARRETHPSPFAMYVWVEVEGEDGPVRKAVWSEVEWLDLARERLGATG